MSYSTMFGLNPSAQKKEDQVMEICRFDNAWGSAFPIWVSMYRKYVNKDAQFMSGNGDDLWPIYRDRDVSMPDYPAIGMQQSSVSNTQFVGEWDEETQENAPMQWDRTFEVYEELKTVKEWLLT